MIGNYKVITLCGSAKFKEDFLREQTRLTLEGNIVLSVVFFDNDKILSEQQREIIGDMHKRKIDLSDEIFVINKNGYIGSTTRSEIEYATKSNKPIKYME
ncbi:hypothetical protein II906_02595 [bacterium]|nr:hypothetical protein [bacterium]